VNWLLAVFLFLHVGGAILAFGPSYTFPFLGAMGGKEPAHVNFALRLQLRIGTTLVVPLAIFQAVTGIGLIWTASVNIFTAWWLVLGIIFYLIALSISLFVLLPELRELIAATSTPPPALAVGVTAPAGPPPRVALLVRRARILGAVTGVLIMVIVLLMVLGANGFI
jgi:hypothetical protein